MAARATASGTISFGLVSIPIKLYTAAKSETVRFNMLHETDKARVKQQLVCSACGDVVERDATLKGYEYSRGQYVALTDDELKALEEQSDRTIAIEEFIPIEKVDPNQFEKSNLLGPDKGGAKAYRLLRRAMAESGKVALGRFATRGKQQLVLIRPTADGLVLHGLYYADEIRSFDDLDLGDEVEIKQGELDLAVQLIEQLSNDRFQPELYQDEYRQRVLKRVDQKIAGEEIVIAPSTEPREQIIDLVAALKKSLAAEDGDGSRGGAKPKRTRKAAKAKGTQTSKRARRKSASS